jgi:glutaredoxin
MNKLILVVLIVGITIFFLKPEWFGFNTEPGTFRGDGSERIVVFTSENCGNNCREAVAYLRASGMAFEELKLDANEANTKLFRQLGGADTVPYLSSGYQKVTGFYPQDYLSVLAAARGLSVLDESMRTVYAHHFDKNNIPLLVMYGTTWCVECAAMREYCNDRKIKLVDWDVETDVAAAKRYEQLAGREYPLVFYGARRMNGFSDTGLRRLMKQ